MRKILLAILACAGALAATACAAKPKLHILNWSDYMDRELVSAFEREYQVDVVYREAESNEEIAELLTADGAHYDLVVPSDYMLARYVELGLLRPLDLDRLPNYATLTVMPAIVDLYGTEAWFDYAIPYAWGTLGILYDATVPGLGDFIEDEEWGALFTAGDLYDVGMYDSARDAVAAALLYLGFDMNSDDEEELAMAEDALLDAGFTAWGVDELQMLVSSGTLDLALVYSGDYFVARSAAEEAGLEVNFDFFVPTTTNVWLDAVCIPTQAEDVDLAYAFLDYMLAYDRALQNAVYVGYNPVFVELDDAMTSTVGDDHPGWNPAPDGADRRIYRFVSDDHAESLIAILERAKDGA